MAITKRFASEDYVIENIKANKNELEEQISLFDKKIDVLENKKIDSPDIANPGQMIVVKTVDDTGKPTEFEAVNIPKTEGGGITVETDPTVPSWAKQPTKPNYTKSDVGLSNVDNIKQYSAENEPPYPVTSVNGKVGSVQLTASDVEARSNTWMPSASDVGALPNTTKIPSSTSDLTNNSGFITKAVSDLANYYLKTETYSKEELDNKISAIPKFAIEVVSSLPTSNISETTVYLVVTGDEENNIYTEYIYVSGHWEYLGKQTVDLTNYVKRTELSIYYSKTEIESLLEELRNFIPTRLSQLADDSSHRTVTDAEKESWNAKSTFSGSYTDLTNKPSIPSLSGYATENFVKGYAQPAGNYLTTIPSEYITESELNAKKYLTSVPGEYITESELSAKGYLTQHQSLDGYAKTSQIPTKTSQLTNDSDFATNESFNKIGGTVEITSSNPEKENTVLTVNPETIDEINLYSAEEIDNLIESVRNGSSSGEIPNLDGYATETYVKNYAQPKGSYLSSIPSEYVTETELNSKGYLTSIPDDIVTHKDDTSMHVVYGVCETAGDVADKVVSVNGNFILKEGAIVIVRFINANSIAAPTLNVNGTGAKPMYRYGTTTLSTGTTTTGWIAGAIQMFTYNGEGWIRDYWNNTTYSNAALGHGYVTCSTDEATTAKTASLSSYALTTGGRVTVKFTNAVPANSTLNVNSKGAKTIYYRGAKITDGVIKAGDIATFVYSSYYHLISIDRWQNDIDEISSELNAVKKEIDDHKTQINGKQPIGNYALKEEIPTVPVKSVNGKTGAVVLTASDVGATTKSYVDGEITGVKALLNQITFNKAEGDTVEEALEWLKKNGDTKQAYILPDGFIYAYQTITEESSGTSYTNVMDNPDAYIKEGYRYSLSSRAFKTYTAVANFASIVIPVPIQTGTITIRIRGMAFNGAYPSIYGGETKDTFIYGMDNQSTTNTTDANGDWMFNVTNTNKFIVTSGVLTTSADNVIVTINEEIKEGAVITTTTKWASTGFSFIQTNHDSDIASLKRITTANTSDIEELKQIVEGGISGNGTDAITLIKNWDAPIYDANIPVFQLSTEKQAMTNATNTPDTIYAKYDALMAKHPKYITKIDLGLCSDGVNHVYRYDFREPEPLHESNKEWSETKTKAIIVTGIHFEWAGIHAMYNALEEIAENPELRNFRRNTHLIVVPVANPYATIANNYQSGLSTPNSYGVRNANGVEIHRNFEVDHVVIDSTDMHYGGAEPLSEVETQYIDNIMKNNTDASLFLSCHNCGVDTFWGTGFIWASTATKYMCNVGYRVIDKMSDAWIDKYGDILQTGIEEYKTDLLEDGDTRLGWAGLSSTAGTEAKQATKYGIQGTNVEICNPFQIHGTKANPEPSMSAFTLSRGAETYINFLLTACGVYDYKDKEQYYK